MKRLGDNFRVYGPVTNQEAEDITERMLDNEKLRKSLEEFLRGDIEAGQLGYQIQIIAENTETDLQEEAKNAYEDREGA